ncbi:MULTISPECIES: response regulator transcription factor [Helicobacter]|uniref:Response regulator transcription factor n=1 Tax=Helicobacter ibis TaxID=2962633 RepID=A0ABT4VCS9_9HELI|nr:MULTISPECIES: response regulator transcription factor [Helicobacter]MDA3966723.1 response regulator transcription factor [Helicobacter sp. WB40]MDA3968509.1 response regulator transcription factor [Helicobacter ibis]
MLVDLLEPLKNVSVLIVEDDVVALDLLKLPLERKCKKVFIANRGELGLKVFKKEAIDVVITDVNLEGNIDGISMVKAMRSIDPKIPVIFMTAYSDEQKISEMIKLNACSLIKKEVDLEELYVLLLGLYKQLHKDEVVDLGNGCLYKRLENSISKGYAVYELTDRERQILELLIGANGYPVTYDEFHKEVWKDSPMTMDSLRMHINSLRRKTYYDLIKNHSRLGYKLIKEN